jgi:hypothetical protein
VKFSEKVAEIGDIAVALPILFPIMA